MNYDKMSVEELLPLYNWNIINATLGKTTEAAAGRNGFELFTAIKKAVIREASVGTMKSWTRPIMGFNQYGDEFQTGHVHEQVTNPLCLPDGDYDLIPKG